MFNIEASANDTHYVPKSKRMWTYELTARMHRIMEDMLTKLARYTLVYLGPDKSRPHPRLQRLNRHAPSGTMRAAHLLMMASVFTAQAADTIPQARHVPQWDTASGLIGIDNRCSGCMSHEAAEFTGELRDCKRVIKGFGGTRYYNIKIGTLK
jgi:hypothetical protein